MENSSNRSSGSARESRRANALSAFLQKLPSFRGKQRLVGLVFAPFRSETNVLLDVKNGKRYLVPSLFESIGFELFINGCFEQENVDFIISRLRSNPGNFLDIGANIGVFSVSAAKALPDVDVLAIEASPMISGYLRNNVELNDLSNIRIASCAVSARDGDSVEFFDAPIEKFGMGALDPRFDGDSVTVNTRTIDSLVEELGFDNVSAIKIDIEGYESNAFRGAEKLLTTSSPTIMFEFCDWAEEKAVGISIGDAQRVLKDFGYEIWTPSDLSRGNEPLNEILTEGFFELIAVKK